MNRKFLIMIVASVLVFFLSCQNTENQSFENKTTTELKSNPTELQWQGSYVGILPCASCPGIKTTIKLNADGSYEKTSEYLESTEEAETEKGKFTWRSDNPSIISISDNNYLVEDNKITMLDADNKVIKGELAANYILAKIVLQE